MVTAVVMGHGGGIVLLVGIRTEDLRALIDGDSLHTRIRPVDGQLLPAQIHGVTVFARPTVGELQTFLDEICEWVQDGRMHADVTGDGSIH